MTQTSKKVRRRLAWTLWIMGTILVGFSCDPNAHEYQAPAMPALLWRSMNLGLFMLLTAVGLWISTFEDEPKKPKREHAESTARRRN